MALLAPERHSVSSPCLSFACTWVCGRYLQQGRLHGALKGLVLFVGVSFLQGGQALRESAQRR
jgi:hypothetical protein